MVIRAWPLHLPVPTNGYSRSGWHQHLDRPGTRPPGLIDAVRQVFGEIDLDPASSVKANKVVQAKSIFTKRTNGLKQKWHGRVFLNPPFDDWPFLDDQARRGDQNGAHEAGHYRWSRRTFPPSGLCSSEVASCSFPISALQYYDPNSDKLIDPPFGSLMCYVGRRKYRFVRVFGRRGADSSSRQGGLRRWRRLSKGRCHRRARTLVVTRTHAKKSYSPTLPLAPTTPQTRHARRCFFGSIRVGCLSCTPHRGKIRFFEPGWAHRGVGGGNGLACESLDRCPEGRGSSHCHRATNELRIGDGSQAR